jgi:dihydroxy-acid dehydratase
MAMDTEEMIRAQPMDSVVLIGGCDKTLPAQLMAAASVDRPAVVLPVGPMLVGHFKGEVLGACTDCRRLWGQHRAGTFSAADIETVSERLAPTKGTCMVMGTASTMASMAEALGVGMPGNAAFPAVDARRNVIARMAGRQIVSLVKQKIPLSKILTRQAFENAIRTLSAIGGSTNAVIHLIALAGRIGVKLDLKDFDRLGKGMNTILNLMPSGKYLMEDFCYAGGLPVVLRELGENNLLHKNALTVNGKTMWENVKDAPCWNRDVIFPMKKPFKKNTGLTVLRGNLAPQGAIIKPSAATPKLLKHKGRAVVFENIEDFHGRIDDPNLDIDAKCVMVLKNCGPKGYPGMAEVGNMPLPPKLLKKGVTDMVRISDARMSGTAYGTVVLHISPEATAGGVLALVQNGDMIELDVAKGKIQLLVSDAELRKRKAKWKKPQPPLERGYWRLYFDHVQQADKGADLDFLVGKSGAFVPRDNH